MNPEEGRRMQDELILDEALTDFEGLEAKAQALEAEAADKLRKAQALRQIVDAVRALNGEAATILLRRSFEAHKSLFETRPLDPSGPRGPKAVLLVMGEDPNRVWKVVDVKREMLRRGWAPTPKAVEASIKRLRTQGDLEPVGYGHYRLARPADHEEVAAA